MNDLPPQGAACARHPAVAAAWTCIRCGSFVCADCERRVRPDAPVLCPGCWELRAAHVAELPKKTDLSTTGFVLGFVALLPIPPVQIAAVIINGMALAKAEPGKRTKPIVGLICSLCGCGGFLALILVGALADS